MEFGQVFYHVANPSVRCVFINKVDEKWVNVIFEKPVGFSGNIGAGDRTHWTCSRNLLFATIEEAVKNNNPSK